MDCAALSAVAKVRTLFAMARTRFGRFCLSTGAAVGMLVGQQTLMAGPADQKFPAPVPETAQGSRTSQPATAPATAPSIAADSRDSLKRVIESAPRRPQYGQPPQTWSEGYQNRMDAVLTPGRWEQDQSCAQWYHSQSQRWLYRNRHFATAMGLPPVGHPKYQAFIEEHTLPPYGVPDVDYYEMRPRVVVMGPIVQTSAEDAGEVPETPGDESDNRPRHSGRERLRKDITAIQPTLSYALRGIEEDQLPDDFHEVYNNDEYVVAEHPATVLQWAPTNLYHHPLYFEDPALERYGHTYHPAVQPFASAGRFAVQLAGLPYQMTLNPIHAKEYTLGWYRPGDCAPKKHYQIPFNEEATLMEAAVIAGMILIFP